ncbi:CinA family nicotinamide mononucleotide deamidase-related protein [Halieaceae bacterium IMCC14734]|uniref:CinA-like protein n=1 Tax=Candidatus Litorirhabdus singularis TaxID=2518993 RepID=A0ABT3TK26_9GAMM|nr:CinA family nicotinamide mononucleotide deamidase-related protein [Candidatus Litorirhabdus singularis]MCX2982661.1 CinA family nicotinamide mononucleotide deamidase-related protein [Candidatus Litorirhabdus singularis]
MNQHNPVVQLLLTGNEIMSGDTVDSNSSMIALRLAELGIAIHRKVTVGDAPALLTAELRDLCKQSDVVIVNGGLGPTIDDLTAEILAAVADVPLQENPLARLHIENWCEARGAAVNAANLKQALLPAGATIVDNAIGSAVGFELEVEGCLVICTPGVPSELRLMLDNILQNLRERLGKSGEVDIIRLQTFGLGESTAQQIISDQYSDWPAQVELGFRAGAPQMEIKLTVSDPAARDAQLACKEKLYQLFGDHIIGEGDSSLAQQVVTLLADRGETLTTAESCTGGLIASMLTRIPGSSAAFHAGFVTYANSIKQTVLDVPESLLQQSGAVSEGVVIAMAKGAMQRADADYGIAVSGVAGPDGGTEEKPVGTVWLAWGSRDNIQTRCLLWPVERTLFQTMIAAAGLDMIRRRLLGIEQDPSYFRSRQAK